MSGKSGKAQRKNGEDRILQILKKSMHKTKAFLSQRHVWLSLAIGFLWMVSTPFVITFCQEYVSDFVDTYAWILLTAFFPFTFSSMIFAGVAVPNVWVIIYGFSFMISMIFCLSVSHIAHKVRLCEMKS